MQASTAEPSSSQPHVDNDFEAVPCMLRNADGASSVYGLLIVPKNGASAAPNGKPQAQPSGGTQSASFKKDRAILPRTAPPIPSTNGHNGHATTAMPAYAEHDHDHRQPQLFTNPYVTSVASAPVVSNASANYSVDPCGNAMPSNSGANGQWHQSHQYHNHYPTPQPVAPQLEWAPSTSAASQQHHHHHHYRQIRPSPAVVAPQQPPAAAPPTDSSTPDSGCHSVTGSPLTPMLSPRVCASPPTGANGFDDMPRLRPSNVEMSNAGHNSHSDQQPSCSSRTSSSLIVMPDDPDELVESLAERLNPEQLKKLQNLLKSKTKGTKAAATGGGNRSRSRNSDHTGDSSSAPPVKRSRAKVAKVAAGDDHRATQSGSRMSDHNPQLSLDEKQKMAERLQAYRVKTARLCRSMSIRPVTGEEVAQLCDSFARQCGTDISPDRHDHPLPFSVALVRRRMDELVEHPPVSLLELTRPPPSAVHKPTPAKRRRLNDAGGLKSSLSTSTSSQQQSKRQRPRSSMSMRSELSDETLTRRYGKYPCAPYTRWTDRGASKTYVPVHLCDVAFQPVLPAASNQCHSPLRLSLAVQSVGGARVHHAEPIGHVSQVANK